jgi:hypothetical protein
MGVLNNGTAFTRGILGTAVTKTTTLSAATTASLFTVSGLVVVTAILGKVTTAITVANTVKLQANPTVGTTGDLCAATDLGTTDTPAGSLLSITGAPGEGILQGVGTVPLWPVTEAQPTAVTTVQTGGAASVAIGAGTIEMVTTGTALDGVIQWYVTYVPIDAGASIAAA